MIKAMRAILVKRSRSTGAACLSLLFLLVVNCSKDPPPAFYHLTGTVTGEKISDVTVMLIGQHSENTQTDSSGNYSFGGLSNGEYTLVPLQVGHRFSPASIPVTIKGANLTDQSFTEKAVEVSWLAGVPESGGFFDGEASRAKFGLPVGVAVDGDGIIYVAEGNNNIIRKITRTSENGSVSVFAGPIPTNPNSNAGFADGDPISEAKFRMPMGIAVGENKTLYVADFQNRAVRKITQPPEPQVSTLAQGSDVFNWPFGVAVDVARSVLYVGDFGNHTIRRVALDGTNSVTTLAGLPGNYASADGLGAVARFNEPRGLAVDGSGNIYVADQTNHTIRKVTLAGEVSTLAGKAPEPPTEPGRVQPGGYADGLGADARFNAPRGVAVDTSGNIYVADTGNHIIRKIIPAGSIFVVTTLAGWATRPGYQEGDGAVALFSSPAGIAVDDAGNLYIADTGNNVIRMIEQ